MIHRFGSDTALLIIDAQRGVNDNAHWGGSCGHRNNPEAELRIGELLNTWRKAGLPVYFTFHDSREAASPLKLSLESGQVIAGLEPQNGEQVIIKDVNSGFIGTELEVKLRRDRISRLVVAGFFTNMCVETTVRAAGNMGYDVYLAHDACAAGNRTGLSGAEFDADLVHKMSVANMHGEFCTAIDSADVVSLVGAHAVHLDRVQGNE